MKFAARSLLGVFFSLISSVSAVSVYQTCLVIAANANEADQAVQILQAYDTPYELLLVPASGTSLPPLESTVTPPSTSTTTAISVAASPSASSNASIIARSLPASNPASLAPLPSNIPRCKRHLKKRQTAPAEDTGFYGLIVIISSVSYNIGGSFLSVLTPAQWSALYAYQAKYSVRMVQLDVFPTPEFGVVAASPSGAGCCSTGEQLIRLTDTTFIPTAGLKIKDLSTVGLWHTPATIQNSSLATPFLTFAPNTQFASQTIGGVINKFDTGREQLVFFTSGGSWSKTTMYLGHVWFHWGYRGIYQGFRRSYLNTQVDDLFLTTDIHVTAVDPNGPRTRITPEDLTNHISWLASINSKMNPGSDYFLEFAFNGNGNVEYAANVNPSCPQGIEYSGPIAPSQNLEWHKPLGTGVSQWPNPVSYIWPSSCTFLDPLAAYFQDPAKRDAFAFMSHTFTHEDFENATYYDVSNEISFNQHHAAVLGLDKAKRWSQKCFVPPAITGLHNGDAIKAFLDNGIVCGVGDNTRPVLRNTQNQHWPLVTTVEGNGFAGFTIIPRWATRIWYDVGTKEELIDEWHFLYPADPTIQAGQLNDLLAVERELHTRALLGLFTDPFMFHQGNLRVTDVSPVTINGVTQPWSLLQMWVETIVTEFTSLTTWPVISLKADDIFQVFVERVTRDGCNAKTRLIYSADKKSITGFEVSSSTNACPVAVPISVPGSVSGLGGGDRTEQVGGDPLTVWVSLTGAPRTFSLSSPVAV